MIALDKKDMHVHSPFCPHRHSEAPLEEYLAAAEKNGIVEVAFTEHAPFPAPLHLTQYTTRPCMTDEETELYFYEMNEFRKRYKGPVKFTIGLEVEFVEGFEEETIRSLEKYGPRIENGLIGVHSLPVDGRYINVDYRQNIAAAARTLGPRNLSELYFKTMIKAVKADLGPYKPKRIAHPTMLALYGKHFPEFHDVQELMEEFVATVKDKGYALDLNTAGLVYPDDCQEIYGEALLPFIKKYNVPVSLGSDAHEPERIGDGFDRPAIQKNMRELHPVWETKV